jgi:hypothetical protein
MPATNSARPYNPTVRFWDEQTRGAIVRLQQVGIRLSRITRLRSKAQPASDNNILILVTIKSPTIAEFINKSFVNLRVIDTSMPRCRIDVTSIY